MYHQVYKVLLERKESQKDNLREVGKFQLHLLWSLVYRFETLIHSLSLLHRKLKKDCKTTEVTDPNNIPDRQICPTEQNCSERQLLSHSLKGWQVNEPPDTVSLQISSKLQSALDLQLIVDKQVEDEEQNSEGKQGVGASHSEAGWQVRRPTKLFSLHIVKEEEVRQSEFVEQVTGKGQNFI